MGGKSMLAPRVAYAIFYGEIGDGLVVRHTCDNPACCNPLHLMTGTHADNVRDRVTRDRSAKGVKNGRAKLTENQVREIRAMKGTMLARDIGARFGVGEDTVYLIHQGQTWRHVT
ncbi:MAG: HNH endonuclease [Patescibacteria group bacterium]|nr:HNH endonuclease [Patescibacteria group bacterium]